MLGRILGFDYEGDEYEFTDQQLAAVTFSGNRLYRHKVVRVNYTTYDGRRDQDSFNPRTHADFMTYSHENVDQHGNTAHPYWYGRIIETFHAEVIHLGPETSGREPRRMEFMLVRWFGRDVSRSSGWKSKRLHRLGFVDSRDEAAFGFLDPAEIIRGVHLIPAFHHGQTRELLGPSIARHPLEKNLDWVYYYVGM